MGILFTTLPPPVGNTCSCVPEGSSCELCFQFRFFVRCGLIFVPVLFNSFVDGLLPAFSGSHEPFCCFGHHLGYPKTEVFERTIDCSNVRVYLITLTSSTFDITVMSRRHSWCPWSSWLSRVWPRIGHPLFHLFQPDPKSFCLFIL